MALAYVRIGALVDRYNLRNILVALYMLVKVGALCSRRTSCTAAPCDRLRGARRPCSERARSVALVEAEKGALEASAADLRALVGNVAHDQDAHPLGIGRRRSAPARVRSHACACGRGRVSVAREQRCPA
jgi:hypothetical protein